MDRDTFSGTETFSDASRRDSMFRDAISPPPGTIGGNGEGAAIGQRSVAQLLRNVISDLGDLTRQEIALAKAEMNEKIAQVQAGAGMLGAGSVLALAGLVVLLMAGVYGLATQMPLWAAALIVGGCAVVIGAVVLFAGKKKMSQRLVPERTAASLKEDAGAFSRTIQ